ASGNNSYAHASGRHKRCRITHAVSRIEVLHRYDFAREGHHRPETELIRGDVRKWRTAVEHDARPHPVAMRLRITQNRSGIREAAFISMTGRHAIKNRHLTIHAAR